MKTIKSRGREVDLEVTDTVYDPAEDTRLMMDSIFPGGSMLEVGCGSGAVSILCSLLGSKVDAVDINPDAVALTLRNADLNGVKLNAWVSDLFASVSGKYDTIVFNPPYLPTDDNIPGAEQWNGGPDGFGVVRRFLGAAPKFLNNYGDIFLILSSLTNIPSLVTEFSNLRFTLAGQNSFPGETIFCFRIEAVTTPSAP
jgi:release factor glutamine methyltransferase